MIHKFWNVRLNPPQQTLGPVADDPAGRELVREEEERMEEKVYRIWSVLSTFEESSAACISDMLLHVSNGAYVDGVMVAKKFIWHVDILFQSADGLDATMGRLEMKGKNSFLLGQLHCPGVVPSVVANLPSQQVFRIREKLSSCAKRLSPFSLYCQRHKTRACVSLGSPKSCSHWSRAWLIISSSLFASAYRALCE